MDSMAELKTVGIKDLKNNLSAYIREVRRGTRVLVSDRDIIVAELREPLFERGRRESLNPIVSEWVAAGLVQLPSTEKRTLRRSPVKLKAGTAREILNELRRDSSE